LDTYVFFCILKKFTLNNQKTLKMIVFSKKTERFLNYIESQFNKQYSKTKDYMPIKGLVEAKLYFNKPKATVKFVINKEELSEEKIDQKIYSQLPDTMYYTK